MLDVEYCKKTAIENFNKLLNMTNEDENNFKMLKNVISAINIIVRIT